MIRRYNQVQNLLLPLHLLLAALGFYFSWLFIKFAIPEFYKNLPFLIPASLKAHESEVTIGFGVLALIAAFIAAFQMWSRDETSLPGILSAVPSFMSPTNHVHMAACEIAGYAVAIRLLGNLFLSGPLQTLFGYQRIQNRIPHSEDLEQRLRKWYDLAIAQDRWHPTGLYAGDYDSLDYLIRMGKLDYSPTKELVKVRAD